MEHIHSGRSWSPELRVFLIRSVRERERLWKKYGSCGTDSDQRMNLWTEVQQGIAGKYKVYVEIDEIKKTWKNLKDNFLRVKKANIFNGNKGASKKWYFYDELKFLDFADSHITDFKPFQTLLPDREAEKAATDEPPRKKRAVGGLNDHVPVVGLNDHLTISIPAIDDRIKSNQKIPAGAKVLDLDDDLGDYARITAGKWGKTERSCQPGALRIVEEDEEDEISMNSPKFEPDYDLACHESSNLLREEELKPSLIESDDFGETKTGAISEHSIGAEILRLRGIYHQAAIVFFMIQGMPEGALNQILVDFDDHVYNNKPRTENMNKVIRSSKHRKEYEELFVFLERSRGKLELMPPSSRWEQEDKVLGKTLKPYYLDHRNPLRVELTVEQRVMRERLKHIQHRKSDNIQQTLEIQREIERINGEMSGQPSVIRRTRLKKMLFEAQKSLKTMAKYREEIEQQFQEQVKILEGSDTVGNNTGPKASGILAEELLYEAKEEPVE